MEAPLPRTFRSGLLVSLRDWDTLSVIRALHASGIAVLEREASDAALRLASGGEFDIVLWCCPGTNSDHEILARLALSDAGVIALLQEMSPELIAGCLESGADACLGLDADARVVGAQISAVLRRRNSTEAAPSANDRFIQVGDLTIDSDRYEVERGGVTVPLSAQEFRVVEYMARNAGRVLRPQDILNAATDEYAYSAREAQAIFKVYARRIRRKLEPDEANPKYLVNVRGVGYRLEDGARPPLRSAAV
jgi:DNA-binding response OmpR family regulator